MIEYDADNIENLEGLNGKKSNYYEKDIDNMLESKIQGKQLYNSQFK